MQLRYAIILVVWWGEFWWGAALTKPMIPHSLGVLAATTKCGVNLGLENSFLAIFLIPSIFEELHSCI
jgi:hypothetical protein